jgi:hypothetical protein
MKIYYIPGKIRFNCDEWNDRSYFNGCYEIDDMDFEWIPTKLSEEIL